LCPFIAGSDVGYFALSKLSKAHYVHSPNLLYLCTQILPALTLDNLETYLKYKHPTKLGMQVPDCT